MADQADGLKRDAQGRPESFGQDGWQARLSRYDAQGPRLLVLSDMGEVGHQGSQFHAEVGAHARAMGVEMLFTLGSQAAQAGVSFGAGRHFDDIAALNAAVLAELPRCASVLVKGSRFMQMERVVQAILARAQRPVPPPQEKEGHAA